MDALGKTPSLIYKSLGSVPRVGNVNTLPFLPGNTFPFLNERASLSKRHTLVISEGKRDAKPFSTSRDATANGETSASADCTDPMLEIDPSPPFATLRFFGFITEPVYDSPLETSRITGVSVLYFTEDATVAISTPTIANSGARGGTILSRSRVAAAAAPSSVSEASNAVSYVGPSMLAIGRTVILQGRAVQLIDADATTRSWYAKRGVTLGAALPAPSPIVPTAAAPRGSQILLPPSSSRVVPAQLSVLTKPVATPPPPPVVEEAAATRRAAAGRAADDGIALRFRGVIDERDRPHGLVRRVTVYHFPADSSVKVVLTPVMTRASRELGDHGGLLAARHVRRDLPASAFVQDAVLVIYGRRVRIVGADAATQRYMLTVAGVPPSAVADMPPDEGDGEGIETVIVPTLRAPRVVANVDTIGTDRLSGTQALALQAAAESSPSSATSLSRRSLGSAQVAPRGVVRLLGRMVVRPVGTSHEVRYVLTFDRSDQSVSIFESAPRNSGTSSGLFLSRSHPLDPVTGAPYTLERLMEGTPVTINGRQFVFEFLSDRRATTLPIAETVRLVRERLWSHYVRPSEAFIGLDKNRHGQVTVADVAAFLAAHALLPDEAAAIDGLRGTPPVNADVAAIAAACGINPVQASYAAVVHYVMDRDNDGVVNVNDFTAFVAANDIIPPRPRPDPEEAALAAAAATAEPSYVERLWARLVAALEVRTHDMGELFRLLSDRQLAARLTPQQLRASLVRLQLGLTSAELDVVVSLFSPDGEPLTLKDFVAVMTAPGPPGNRSFRAANGF